MFYIKAANNLINKVHECSLRDIYVMEYKNLEDLLIKNSSSPIRESNIHKLLIKICKSSYHISLLITQEFFDLKVTPYSLRNSNQLKLPKTNFSGYVTQPRCFKGSITWAESQIDIKIDIKVLG